MSRTLSRLAAIAVFLIAQADVVTAAEVKVFSTIGVQAALEELAPKFEQATGNKLNITWATAAILVKRVQAGETADLMVLTKQSLDALTKERRTQTGYLHAGCFQAGVAQRKEHRLVRSGGRRRKRRPLR